MFNYIDKDIHIDSLEFHFVDSAAELNKRDDLSDIEIIIFFPQIDITPPFKFNLDIHSDWLNKLQTDLDTIHKLAHKNATLYVSGMPTILPYASVHLDSLGWQFKYWLALKLMSPKNTKQVMQDVHHGILFYVRNKKKFNIHKIRSPHLHCDVCGDLTADWGGKKHLRNPHGYAISDVWDDLPNALNEEYILSRSVWQRLILMTANNNFKILCVNYQGKRDINEFILR